MTILLYSVAITQARWFRGLFVLIVTLATLAVAVSAAPAKKANKKNSRSKAKQSASRARAAKSAKRVTPPAEKKSPPPLPSSPALAALATGVRASMDGRPADAVQSLGSLRGKLSKVEDYVAYHLATAKLSVKDYPDVVKHAETVLSYTPASPYRSAARILRARASIETGAAAGAVQDLRQNYPDLPQPSGDLALADAYQAAGEPAQAAVYYQRVFYGYPTSEQAAKAESAIVSMRASLADAYPPAPASQRLARAAALLSARQFERARSEYADLTNQLSGPERDIAAAGVGAADFMAGKTSQACRYLEGQEFRAAEAAAQRAYHLLACARDRDDTEAMDRHLEALEKSYRNSTWRLKALVSTGNRYLIRNAVETYVPLFKQCAEDFPNAAEAPYCHWKVVWVSYLGRKRNADDLLREHIERFPDSAKASSALYFLGRIAEKAKKFDEARVYYERVDQRYRGYYYAHIARERLAQPAIARAPLNQKTVQYLDQLRLPTARAPLSFEATRESEARIERARILNSAGLEDLAIMELRFGARSGAQPHLLAMELARMAGEPPSAMRHMKSLVRDYFAMAPEDAPDQFWHLLFPLPYRESLLQESERNALDPHMVAGLIRQESEFNPRAVSRARAYGLTQIVPSTGRQLARRAGVRRFNTSMLFQPAINLKLGTIYLRNLLDQWGGKWEETLASYNAGKSRVDEWRTWGEFEEPAEFIETIPFTETRDYVQAVIRNAFVYRRLYGDSTQKRASADVRSAGR